MSSLANLHRWICEEVARGSTSRMDEEGCKSARSEIGTNRRGRKGEGMKNERKRRMKRIK